jgi:hypothetical protein
MGKDFMEEADKLNPDDFMSDARQCQLIEMARQHPAASIRQAIREAVAASRLGIKATAVEVPN